MVYEGEWQTREMLIQQSHESTLGKWRLYEVWGRSFS